MRKICISIVMIISMVFVPVAFAGTEKEYNEKYPECTGHPECEREREVFVKWPECVESGLPYIEETCVSEHKEREEKSKGYISSTVNGVSTSGENWIFIVIGSLTGIISLVIVLPRYISFIRRFI
jgi:hypothetical protein